MAERRALWASTADPAGIGRYVSVMQAAQPRGRWRVRHVVTHRSGSYAARAATYLRGVATFVVQLAVFRPHVVHLQSPSRGSFVRKAVLLRISRLARVPVVLHLHGLRLFSGYDAGSRSARWLVRSTLERSDAAVALAGVWAQRTREVAPHVPIVVLPNPVTPAPPRSAPSEPVRVLFLGVLREDEGVLTLLDAWERLGDADLRARLGTAARERVAERYTPDIAWNRLAHLYDEVAR